MFHVLFFLDVMGTGFIDQSYRKNNFILYAIYIKLKCVKITLPLNVIYISLNLMQFFICI
jgi:hypothetical protein